MSGPPESHTNPLSTGPINAEFLTGLSSTSQSACFDDVQARRGNVPLDVVTVEIESGTWEGSWTYDSDRVRAIFDHLDRTYG